MAAGEEGTQQIFETCSFACEIDFTEILNAGGVVEFVQSRGALRLRVSNPRDPSAKPRDIEVETSDKPDEPKAKVHKYRFKGEY